MRNRWLGNLTQHQGSDRDAELGARQVNRKVLCSFEDPLCVLLALRQQVLQPVAAIQGYPELSR